MATGLTSDGGVMAPADVRDAGELEWSTTSGVSPTNPIASRGRPDFGFDPDWGRGDRIVTTPEGNVGGPAGGGVMATPDGVQLLDDWRDLLNFKGSPMPWLLLGALIFVGFMSFRVEARARAGARRASASAALG